MREDDEWAAGHSPDARHLAMGSVADRIDEIPTDRTVVCVCRVGGRSGAVAGALADAGYDVRNLAGRDAGLGGGRASGGDRRRCRRSDHLSADADGPVTVYLDDWRQPARLGPVEDRWSHLLADTDEELHAFAARMGMKREWFQHRTHRPHQAHYDMPETGPGAAPWPSARCRCPGDRSGA